MSRPHASRTATRPTRGAVPVASVAAALLACAAMAGTGDRSPPAVGAYGFDEAGMDRSVRPGDDFYRYANGGWERATPIPDDRASTGTISALEDRSVAQVRAILEEAARDPASRMGTLYRSFLDDDRIERLGTSPIEPWLARIRAVRTVRDYLEAAGEAGRRGVELPLAFVAAPDDRDPGRYALTVGQAGLGMPGRDYYLSPSPGMAAARSAYRAYLRTILAIGGVEGAAGRADAILRLETEIAAASWPAADARDAARTYNPSTLAALDAGTRNRPATTLARGLGFRASRVVVLQPSAVRAIARLVDRAPAETLRAILVARTLHRYAPVLPRAARAADLAFYGRALAGVVKPEPRWREAIALTLAATPDDVSRVYVARHFTPATRVAAERMVAHLVAAFDRRIDALDWMTPPTKARAHRKLAAFHARIGYPDRWRDYAGLTVVDGDAFGNAVRAAELGQAREARRPGRAVDRWEWSYTPMTVDAFANFPKVEITFPAAILQPPFFDPAADPTVNYGGIGASIAHEMTHQFDDQGSRYDEGGRLATWWTPADRAAFDRRTAALAAQFGAYEPLPGVRIDGRLTLGENIADLGGLAIAYDAYRASLGGRPAPTLAGTTGDQRFFLGWAQIWRLSYRDADLRRRLSTNPHAPAAQRVWTVRNLPAWETAFGVRSGDRLHLGPADRVSVW